MWTQQSPANSALPLAACKQPSTTQEFEQVQLCSNKLYLQRQAKGQIQSASYIAESWSNWWKIEIPAVKEKNMHKQFFKRLWHRDIGRHREQTLGTVGRGKGRRNWESSTEIHTCSSVQFSRSVMYNWDPMVCSTPLIRGRASVCVLYNNNKPHVLNDRSTLPQKVKNK